MADILPLRRETEREAVPTVDAALEALLRRVVREELAALKADLNEQDRLLDAEEAARLLSISPDWLYRNVKRLPFTRKLGPKMLRFSAHGLQKYLATRKIC